MSPNRREQYLLSALAVSKNTAQYQEQWLVHWEKKTILSLYVL